ncbi:MAG TPA: transcriptional regulator [Ruminococcaceae bacterium]|nr:transcriptional regulator [Oscillospiraceae bacterium]
MKLIIAIVNNEDSAVVAAALTKENFTVTKLSTTGGFLMVGNTTFLIGTEESRVALAKDIIQKHSRTRTHTNTTSTSFGRGFAEGALEDEVTVGGATVLVLNVEDMEKY